MKSDTESNSITLSAPGGETEYTLCDVKAGTWTVSDGTTSNTYQATEDGNVLSFTDSSAEGTTLTVTYTSSTVTETVPNPQPTNIDYYYLYNDTEQYYTEHMARLDVNKKPLVAAEDIAEKKADVEITLDGAKVELEAEALAEAVKDAKITDKKRPPRGNFLSFVGKIPKKA